MDSDDEDGHSGDDSEDDKRFGGAVKAENDDEVDSLPPPYSDEELARVDSDLTVPEPSSSSVAKERLTCPVIIPQRRPGDKTRGFERAYAPVLEEYGINQDSFLHFLKSFHKASKVRYFSANVHAFPRARKISDRLVTSPRLTKSYLVTGFAFV